MRTAAPRPGFFVEPILRQWVERDPEGERRAHDVFYFVVDGTEEELEVFHRQVIRVAMAFTENDRRLRWQVDIETILVGEAASWRLIQSFS